MRVIKDSFLEVWRGKLSYIIFTLFILGLTQTLAVVYNINKWNFSKTSLSVKILFITTGYLSFSYIWKSLILVLISSYLLSKYTYQHKLYFLFLFLNRKKFFILRILSVGIISFFVCIIWDISGLSVILFFYKIHMSSFFFYTIIENFTIIWGSTLAAFIGLYFSPLSLSFLMLLVYFFSSIEIFFTPFIRVHFPYILEVILKKIPSLINVISYFPLRMIEHPEGSIDLMPRGYDFWVYLILSIPFLIISLKKIEKMEYDIF